ncbi:MAG: cytochrome c maturation protein CcmE [Alphaproteobacteria bacterium]|nr:cytochrome c maturation protein CcmE [Alphaproteobacteria bacterium]
MKPKSQRLILVILGVASLTASALFALSGLKENIVFFLSPTEIAQKHPGNTRIRIGGLVKEGSIVHGEGEELRFVVTDGAHDVPVLYRGVAPSLFREGQGVVAEGALEGETFHAARILAKHDENYMPPEVVKALKASGQWKP